MSILMLCFIVVEGAHFLLQDITVENSTGPGTQAVALYCHAEYAIFYKCKITGYQDTLFADSTQQFYRECDIYGTVDFIFGDARALFQNCNLFARDTGAVFTAHSRDSVKESSGYVIQNCSLKASPEIATNVATNISEMNAYLGRPWRKFSTVIVMESFIDAIFNPLGWEPMGGSHGELVTYREYNNRGGGANVTGRVKWKGYKVIRHHEEAMQYTARNFIDGNTWIPQTGVPYYGGLAFT
ncbi:probable pectinesterase/pectinesterase inhibitor 25 [Rhododendron vialii]|uniref:probable pectinesterase/pectinesterase inhibitor 25 n=1 Tax=Rhododendron vialii TaxID=182163 RepID=UPI00265E578D|nr:probable pectinesterase/pectinesterase inhibitor 25 [Rhododendron vialii]